MAAVACYKTDCKYNLAGTLCKKGHVVIDELGCCSQWWKKGQMVIGPDGYEIKNRLEDAEMSLDGGSKSTSKDAIE